MVGQSTIGPWSVLLQHQARGSSCPGAGTQCILGGRGNIQHRPNTPDQTSCRGLLGGEKQALHRITQTRFIPARHGKIRLEYDR